MFFTFLNNTNNGEKNNVEQKNAKSFSSGFWELYSSLPAMTNNRKENGLAKVCDRREH